jgi:hypothetical protein
VPPVPSSASQYFWPLTTEDAGTVTLFHAATVSPEALPLVSSAPGWPLASA